MSAVTAGIMAPPLHRRENEKPPLAALGGSKPTTRARAVHGFTESVGIPLNRGL
jgi:hypothetical protein